MPPELPGLTFVSNLGTGGYAEVFLYEQTNTQLRVAVKVLFKEHLTDRAREQFAAESKVMAELADHPYIVQVFQAAVTTDGRPYLVMKYYPRPNLLFRARYEHLEISEVLQIGVRIACAVETAHRAGILHRDIKPANILTSQYGEPGLTDFGIATKGVDDEHDESQGLSVPWSAPEVVFALSPGDRTSDIYSLGATIWHLLAGHSPFEVPSGDNSDLALMRRIREQPIPRTGRADVPASLERLLAHAMAKDPADRPQSALELARSMQAVESEQRWSLTPLVLLDDNRAGSASSTRENQRGEDEVQTRRQQPQVVIPTIEVPPGLRQTSPPEEGRTVDRLIVSPSAKPLLGGPPPNAEDKSERSRLPFPRTADEPPTVRRATVGRISGNKGPDAKSDTTEEPTRRPSIRLRLVASLVVVVALIATGVALLHHGTTPSNTTTTTSSTPTLAIVVPDDPVVTGARLNQQRVSFHWSEPDAQSGDVFEWRVVGSGSTHQATGNSVTLNARAPAKVCIVVDVLQDDGTESAQSTPTCVG
jgi:serine/threonine protein kinase